MSPVINLPTIPVLTISITAHMSVLKVHGSIVAEIITTLTYLIIHVVALIIAIKNPHPIQEITQMACRSQPEPSKDSAFSCSSSISYFTVTTKAFSKE